jgi:hypothetical protein
MRKELKKVWSGGTTIVRFIPCVLPIGANRGKQGCELVDQLYADKFVDDSPGGGKGRELIKEAVAGFHKGAKRRLRLRIGVTFVVD